jgi:hypothetical protein
MQGLRVRFGIRHSPRPLCFKGDDDMHNSGGFAPRGYFALFSPLSWPGLTGPSSIPETFDVTSAFSGILGRPVKPGDDIEVLFEIRICICEFEAPHHGRMGANRSSGLTSLPR